MQGEQTGFSFAELLSTIQARADYTSADSSASNEVIEKVIRTLMDTVCYENGFWIESITNHC